VWRVYGCIVFAYLNAQVSNPFQVISLSLKRSCEFLLRKELRNVQGKALLMCFAQSTPPSQAKTCMTILATTVLEEVCRRNASA
jgi:hypothetical protein